jgi:ubiquinone/menaquinone biosynthesis C-methylase UbiE
MSHWAATGQFQGKRGERHRPVAAAAQLIQTAIPHMTSPPPDWQLPAGVSRGLWQYVHDDAVASNYDASLGDSALLNVDCHFVQKHCPKPGRLIDLGCGTGRLAIAMARRGHWALGVDLSAPMLRVAGDKATTADVFVERVQANLVELGGLDDASFDYAACLFSTLGMIAGVAERRRMLAHVYRLLRPGGVLVLHVHNRWFNFWNPQGRAWLLRDVVGTLTGRAGTGDRYMPPHGDMPPLTLHLFTQREVLQLLRGAGFKIREVRPVSLRVDGKLRWARWFGWLRAYGYLIAAERSEG